MGSLWFHTLGVENFYGVFDSWIIFNDIILIYFDLKLTKFEMNFENREDLKDPTPKTQIYTQCFFGEVVAILYSFAMLLQLVHTASTTTLSNSRLSI